MLNKATAANQNEIDADMESTANGTSFGNLGFGASAAPKPADQANKNIFGSGSLFGGLGANSTSTTQATQQKSPFGTGILKNPTFMIGSQPTQPASLFGNNLNTPSSGAVIFGSSALGASSTGKK